MKSQNVKRCFRIRLFLQNILSFMAVLFLAAVMSSATDKTSFAKSGTAADQSMQHNLKSRILALARSGHLDWLCYYGSDRAVLALPNYNLLILEADALGPITKPEKDNKMCIAYMSIGEIAKNRWFWPLVKDKPWVLKENTDWADTARIDPRSKEWSDLLVHKIAPALLKAGYDGFMLDNVDVGEYLEQKDPKVYAGAKTAVIDIIKRLRQTYPHAALITNGGLETAAEAADYLDAVVRESIFSRWKTNNNGTISYVNVSPQGRAWLRPRLLRIQREGLPILDLEYVDPKDVKEQERIIKESRDAGYFPYIAQKNLMHLPDRQNLPVSR